MHKERINSKDMKGFIGELAIVYTLWFLGNLLANYFMSVTNTYRLGNIIYYIAVTIFGVILPYHLCKKRNIELLAFPPKKNLMFVLLSIGLIVIMTFLGIQAMSEEGGSLCNFTTRSLLYTLAPLPMLFTTMCAYSLLWHGFILSGLKRYLGKGIKYSILAVFLTAFLYGVYHFASIDEFYTFNAMFEEFLITTAIGILLGIYMLFGRSLIVIFVANWITNFFIFTPDQNFHKGFIQSFEGPIVLVIIFVVYVLLRSKSKIIRDSSPK
jgi:membrane protease YdiL (CAAX protease family)